MTELSAEDAKLVTLARATRLRAYAPYSSQPEGAAVRDADGRTYAAATVEHKDPALAVSALRAAVAAAISSGVRDLEAAAVVTEQELAAADLAVLAEFAPQAPVHLAGPDGRLRRSHRQ